MKKKKNMLYNFLGDFLKNRFNETLGFQTNNTTKQQFYLNKNLNKDFFFKKIFSNFNE